MQRSTDKILTTHTGSLPRPKALLDLLKEKDDGKAVDPLKFEAATAGATHEVVRKQIEAGIDIVNDGEMSKIGYATYVKDRLAGFDGQGSFPPTSDFVDFPEFVERFLVEAQGVVTLKTPACSGAVAWKDKDAPQKDISRFRAALVGQHPREAFMTAASPGVIALFLENKYYPTLENTRSFGGCYERRVRGRAPGRLRPATRLPRSGRRPPYTFCPSHHARIRKNCGATRRGHKSCRGQYSCRPDTPSPVLGQLRRPPSS